MRQDELIHMSSLPQLPKESDCGLLYPKTGHNQSNNQIASQNVHDIVKTMEQENKKLKSLVFKSRDALTRFTQQAQLKKNCERTL